MRLPNATDEIVVFCFKIVAAIVICSFAFGMIVTHPKIAAALVWLALIGGIVWIWKANHGRSHR